MKKDKKDVAFRFGIVEEKGKNIVFEITEEEYKRQLDAGISPDEMLPVGLHKARRGGFLERHPNFKRENVEIRITDDKQNAAHSLENDKDKKAA